MVLLKQYAPIRESLALREQKMNKLLVPLCAAFAALSLFYVIRFFSGSYYTPADGILYTQIYYEIASVGLQILCAVVTLFLRKQVPWLPRYLFTAVFLFKAVASTVFMEFDYFIFYVVPICFAIGYYNMQFSVVNSILSLGAYVTAEIVGIYYGIPKIAFYDVTFTKGLLFQFSDGYYAYNRLLGQTVPNALMLLFLCTVTVFLAKNGANSILREHLIGNEKAALDKEMSLGKDIQQSMLPDRVLCTPYFEAYSYMSSAKNVGGDFYDYFPVGDDKVLFVIGDVSGKGISASLMASNTKALIRAFGRGNYEPYEILQEVNTALCSTNRKKLFVTVWLGLLNLNTGDCAYCNAGHNPPLLKPKEGPVTWLDGSPDFVVGRRAHRPYTQHHLFLQPGDSLILYTDGVTEAMNEKAELYGSERLFAFAENHAVNEPFTRGLRQSVEAYRGAAEQNDDWSVACLTYTRQRETAKTERHFKAVREEYPHLCEFVRTYAARHTDNKRILTDLEVSLGEVFSNIEFYSAADTKTVTDVTVELSYENGMMSVVFTDNGIPFNPLEKPAPDLAENIKNKVVGGFGIFMVRKLMDEVSYQYENGNRLTLKKKLTEESV